MKSVLFALLGALTFSYSVAAAFLVREELIERASMDYGAAAGQRLGSWGRLLQVSRTLPERRKIDLVNSFFNQAQFKSDLDHWQLEDYWATPYELLGTNGGDCEDYSIAKYFTLRELGVDPGKLRITYVKALKLNQAHMVLAYFPDVDGDPLILDNLIREILPGSQRADLYPVYSFNGEGLWLVRENGGEQVGQATRLSKWNELNQRMAEQLGSTL